MSDIKMRGPKGCAATLSFDGQTYTRRRGLFTVPEQACIHLKRHGFTVDGEEDAGEEDAGAATDPAAVDVGAAEADRSATR